MGLRKNFHSILRCHSHSRSRSFPGITTSHSRSQNSGMEFPFPFPKIGNEIFIPVPKSWECNLSFPFPFPKFGNGLSHSRSRSQMSKSHSRSPLQWVPWKCWLDEFSLSKPSLSVRRNAPFWSGQSRVIEVETPFILLNCQMKARWNAWCPQ